MAQFSIVTNIAALIAQENLGKTNAFQQTTITRLTSGLRINSSADDAAGLAVANKFRSDISVLQQGIRNGADGLSTLQTIDGGLNNISLLIDRARTLATQSASGTFQGDRNTLNSEFQSVLGEIDRQAQAVGLDPGGVFNRALSVFIGGGRANGGVSEIQNGAVSIDLSGSAVNSNRLGLKGVQALGGVEGTTDISNASPTTSVETIVGDATNLGSLNNAGFTEFKFSGAGFSDDGQATVSVNLNGVVDSSTLASAVNAAIQGAATTSAAGQAFKDAGIEAVINTDSTGKQQLAFKSSGGAFQVQAGDLLSNALLGNFGVGAAGATLDITRTGAATGGAVVANGTIQVVFSGGGLLADETLSVAVLAADDQSAVAAALQTAIAANTTLTAAGFSAASDAVNLTFTNGQGEKFGVSVVNDVDNTLGFGTAILGGAGGNLAQYDTVTGTAALDNTAGTATISVLVEGASAAETITVTTTGAESDQQIVDQINAAIAGNSTLSGAGLIASEAAGILTLETTTNGNGTNFVISVDDDAVPILSFNDSAAGISTGTLAEAAGYVEATINSGGAQATQGATAADPQAFTGLIFGSDVQNLTISARNDVGVVQSITIDLTYANAQTVDEALKAINTELQQSNNSTLQQIVAVKENITGAAGDGIRFLTSLEQGFSVGVGDLANDHGVANDTVGGDSLLLESAQLAGGSIADISSQENAEKAVSSLAQAVDALSAIQGNVGRGQNQLQFAISLASTQITNLSAAESRIRDADLALEAANLTRAGIAQQAGIAALAQANSAPQAVLALLRG